MVVAPPSGFMDIGGALNGALTDVGNLFMAIGTFVWNVASWFFSIAIDPAFIVNPLLHDLTPVYQGAYTQFLLPLLPLIAIVILAYAVYRYFRGQYAGVLRTLGSGLLSIVLVVVLYAEFPFLFRVVDDLALQTTSSVMSLLETTLSSGHITKATQPVDGLVSTYLTEPWELMQFGFLLTGAKNYELQGGMSGQTFQTLLSNLSQTDATWSQSITVHGIAYPNLLQYAFTVPYPNQVTLPASVATKQVLNPQFKTDPHAPQWITEPSSTVTITGLGTPDGATIVPDWRNVFYTFDGQEQQSAIANSFFIKGQQTVTGASTAPNSNGSLDENHFFSGSGNVALILLTALLSLVPLAFTLYTGFQLLMRELQFFFKLGQGIFSIPFLMVPEKGPQHTKQWLRQGLGHLVERFGTGVYFAITVGLGSLFENLIGTLITGNPELSMMLSMLFLAVWYVGAFIYREKLFFFTVHPLANTIGGSQSIAGRGFSQRLLRQQEWQKKADERLSHTQKEREEAKKQEGNLPRRGRRAQNIRTMREPTGQGQSSQEPLTRMSRASSKVPHKTAEQVNTSMGIEKDNLEQATRELTPREQEQVMTVFPALSPYTFLNGEPSDDAFVEDHDSELAKTRIQATNQTTIEKSASYDTAKQWIAQQRFGITHLNLKRAMDVDERTADHWMHRLADEKQIVRDGNMWRFVGKETEKESEATLNNAVSGKMFDESESSQDVSKRVEQNSSVASDEKSSHEMRPQNSSLAEAEPSTEQTFSKSTSKVVNHEQVRRKFGMPVTSLQEKEINQKSVWNAVQQANADKGAMNETPSAPRQEVVMKDTDTQVETVSMPNIKQWTRKIGTQAQKIGQSEPVMITAKTSAAITKQGYRIARGTMRGTVKIASTGSKTLFRMMEWHADRLGNPSQDGFIRDFQTYMLSPSRTEQRMTSLRQTGRSIGRMTKRPLQRSYMAKKSKRMIKNLRQTAAQRIKMVAKDWLKEEDR